MIVLDRKLFNQIWPDGVNFWFELSYDGTGALFMVQVHGRSDAGAGYAVRKKRRDDTVFSDNRIPPNKCSCNACCVLLLSDPGRVSWPRDRPGCNCIVHGNAAQCIVSHACQLQQQPVYSICAHVSSRTVRAHSSRLFFFARAHWLTPVFRYIHPSVCTYVHGHTG